VIGFSEVISDEILGPAGSRRYVDYARDINSSARHLLSLINDVLDISMVEADRLDIAPTLTDVSEVVGLAVRQIGPQADAHGLELRVAHTEAHPTIRVDRKRLLQILLNLLSNAVRFTPAGGVVAVETEFDGDAMRLIVADTGIGMTREQTAIALSPFGQPHSAPAPNDRGCGLGLPLAQRLARLHGGDLNIESAAGLGCRVIVSLPRRGPVHIRDAA